MTEALPVHVWLPGESTPVRAGTFAYDADRPLGEFRYDSAYLEARAPSLAPDIPLKQGALRVATGKAIFPLLLDAGPDSWGRHMLSRRLGRDITEFEALSVCPTDGVGNLALGDLTEARMQLLSIDQFLAILAELEAAPSPSSPWSGTESSIWPSSPSRATAAGCRIQKAPCSGWQASVASGRAWRRSGTCRTAVRPCWWNALTERLCRKAGHGLPMSAPMPCCASICFRRAGRSN